MRNNMFDLDTFTESPDYDLFDTPINEEGEFASGSYATNDVDNHLTDAKISVPADKNYSSIWDMSISVPDGLNETPKSKPYDAASIPVPQGTELTTDEWNKAMSALKQSFKEGYELMGMLESMKIVERSKSQIQRESIDNAMFEAAVAAIEDGPFFEEVERTDKGDVKKIVRKLRKPIKQAFDEYDLNYGSIQALLKAVYGAPTAFATNLINTKLWQYLGYITCEGGSVEESMKQVNTDLADQLDGYKVMHVRIPPDVFNALRSKFNWDKVKSAYLLLVDRNLTKDLKADIKSFCDELKAAAEKKANKADKTEKKDEKKEDAKEEKKDK